MQGYKELVAQILEQSQRVIVDKEKEIKLCISAYLAGLHILIDDIPGVGKTTLAKTLSHVLGLDFSRVQFTSDLLPSDIIGINFYNAKEGSFSFKKGAIFSQFLLADEINRASSKTQSALLEAMEERQVSIDGVTYPLPSPFFVIATKNPNEEIGVYELPSSQLDRFALSLALGYPNPKAERAMLKEIQKLPFDELNSLTPQERVILDEQYKKIYLDDAILDIIQDILAFTRTSGLFTTGLSPRCALSLVKIAKAWALLHLREYVIPQDILDILPYITNHRLKTKGEYRSPKEIVDAIVSHLSIDT